MFQKSQILRATPRQHINLKQSLKIEIHKFWVSNMHKICGSQNCMKIVINNSSGYYNMFSWHQSWILSNLGWVLARTSTHTQAQTLFFFFWKIWFFMMFFNLSKYELFWRTHTWKFFFQNFQILNVFLDISFII